MNQGRLPFSLQDNLLTWTQNLLEVCCFEFARMHNPEKLDDLEIEVPRQRELQGWFVILGKMRIPQGAVRRTEGLADAMFGMRTLRNSAAHRIRAIPIPVLRDMVRQACHITSSFFDDTRHGMLESVLSELNKLASHISLVCDGEVLRGSIFGTLKLSVEENSKYQFVEPDNSIGELSRDRSALEKTQESGKDLVSGLPCSSNLDQAPIPFRDVTGRSSKKGQPQPVSSSEETPGLGHLEFGDVRGHTPRKPKVPVLFGDVRGLTSAQDQALLGVSPEKTSGLGHVIFRDVTGRSRTHPQAPLRAELCLVMRHQNNPHFG